MPRPHSYSPEVREWWLNIGTDTPPSGLRSRGAGKAKERRIPRLDSQQRRTRAHFLKQPSRSTLPTDRPNVDPAGALLARRSQI